MKGTGVVVFEDERLRIALEPGSSALCVVSFAGVGLGLGGIQTAEFRRSLAKAVGDEACVIHVADKLRSWYGDGLDREITARINAVLHERRIERTATLGNSMGGYGAVLLARRLKGCFAAVAFSAQSCVDPAIAPFETRYADWTSKVGGWDEPDAARALDPALRYTLVYGGADPIDLVHAERFRAQAGPRTDIRVVAEAGHRVAAWLRDRRALYPLLQSLLLGGEPLLNAVDETP